MDDHERAIAHKRHVERFHQQGDDIAALQKANDALRHAHAVLWTSLHRQPGGSG